MYLFVVIQIQGIFLLMVTLLNCLYPLWNGRGKKGTERCNRYRNNTSSVAIAFTITPNRSLFYLKQNIFFATNTPITTQL